MNAEATERMLEDVCLKHDNGADIVFRGRLFAESSWFDEESATLTRQKLYVAENNDQVYYIVRGSGQKRERRAYRVSVRGDQCVIRNGAMEMTLQFDMLMLAVRGLCGLKDANATPSLDMVEEMLKAANS